MSYKESKIKSKNDWIMYLENSSPIIKNLRLKKSTNGNIYVRYEGGLPVFDNPDAYCLANCEAHNALIINAAHSLLQRSQDNENNIKKLLGDLLGGETYGAFCELAVYEWLMRHEAYFSIQVNLNSVEVLAKNGSILDGCLNLHLMDAYFDVKGFGFHAHKINILHKKLESEISDFTVLIGGSWDISIEDIQILLEPSGFNCLLKELQDKKFAQRGKLSIRLENKKPITISYHTHSPYLLAQENARYPYRFAHQFSRNKPFMLFFVTHPWFNVHAFQDNVAGSISDFTRAIARRAFMQFSNDSAAILNDKVSTTYAEASQLLSGIVFLNVWPKLSDMEQDPLVARIYLNPRAKNKLLRRHFALLLESNRNGISIEDFVHDDY